MKWPFSRFQVFGESMLPYFKPGDRVLVWRWGKIHAGDTVVCQKLGLEIIKRVERREGESWRLSDFGLVKTDEILGKVIAKY